MYSSIFKKIFDQSPVASQIFSPDGTLQMVNKAWKQLWNLSDEIDAGTYNVFSDPQLADTGIPAFRRALAGEVVLLPAYPYDPAASGLPGRARWLRTHIFPSLASDGSVEAVVVLHEDITETKTALERYRVLVDNAQEVFLVLQEGRIVFANRTALEFTAYDEKEIIGREFLSFVHPDDREISATRYQRRLRGEPIDTRFRLRFIDKTGETRWLAGTASRIEWDGAPALLCLCNDVTSQVQMEEELRQNEKRFRMIAQSSSDMIHLSDTDGTLLFVNRATETLLGYPAEELIGSQILNLVHPDDRERTRQNMAAIAAGKKSGGPINIRLLRRDGSILPVEISCFSFAGQDGPPLLGAVLRDISKRLAEEQVREQRLHSLGLLAGGIAHDFNNLLTAITGNLSLLQMRLPTNDELHRHIAEIDKACGRAQRLTGQLLTFARGGSPVKQTTDLVETIRESATFVLRGSPVAPRFDIPDDLWLVDVDPGQISQVIQNIVINAAHAMPDGGTVTITAANRTVAEGEISGLTAGPHVVISIEDEGVGMPPDILDRIFDPYFTTKKTGSGLGLAAAYSIIKKHDGAITVRSEPGRGSVFSVFLPASGTTGRRQVTEETQDPAKGSGRILVMDDDQVIRSLASTIANHLGYQVETVADGAAAVALYVERYRAGTPFDAAILDLTVPGGIGGREAAHRILAVDPSARLIASSGYTNDDVMARPEQHGFAGILPKPYRLAEFSQTLAAVLDPNQR